VGYGGSKKVTNQRGCTTRRIALIKVQGTEGQLFRCLELKDVPAGDKGSNKNLGQIRGFRNPGSRGKEKTVKSAEAGAERR